MATLVQDPVKARLIKERLIAWGQSAGATQCSRCGGLMVTEQHADLEVRRCVQCGDLVDPVILHNRRRHLPAGLLSLVLLVAGILAPVVGTAEDRQGRINGSYAAERLEAEVAEAGTDWHSAAVELSPDTAESWQSRPEGELLYVLEGTGRLEIEGRPPATLNHGTVIRLDSVPRHILRNTSRTRTLKILVVYALEKGREHPLLVNRRERSDRSGGRPSSNERGKSIGPKQQESADIGLIF